MGDGYFPTVESKVASRKDVFIKCFPNGSGAISSQINKGASIKRSNVGVFDIVFDEVHTNLLSFSQGVASATLFGYNVVLTALDLANKTATVKLVSGVTGTHAAADMTAGAGEWFSVAFVFGS